MASGALRRGAARLRRQGAWPLDGPPPAVPSLRPGDRIGPPDFVGVGAMKAGTSWWYEVIAAHPQVHHPTGRPKELHWFDRFGDVVLDAPVADYHRWFPRGEGEQAGEWTPRYMYDVWTPPMLAAMAPEAKVLVLLRDPIDRYLSGLAHDLSRGRATHTPLPMLVADHVARGRYREQLVGVLRHIDPSRLLVLQYERCVIDPPGEAARTFAFLGLPPVAARTRLGDAVNATRGDKPVLSPAMRAELVATYAPDLRWLAAEVPELDLALWPSALAI